MDSLDSLSTHSDVSFSSRTSLSGLSTYRGEFINLKSFLNPEKCDNGFNVSSNENVYCNVNFYEEQITNLTKQLENALKQCEKIKNENFHIERKTQVACNDKIDKLLRKNNQLETKLQASNDQIERLLSHYGSHESQSESVDLKNKTVLLEKTVYDQNLKYLFLENKLSQIKQEKDEFEQENVLLKTETNEFKTQLESKIYCIKELKEKISVQYVEYQNLLQNNIELKRLLSVQKNEFLYLKKTENWFKENLHMCQKEKQKLINEFSKERLTFLLNSKKIDDITVEVSKWQAKCEDTELRALKTKEILLRKYEDLKNNFLYLNADQNKEQPNYIGDMDCIKNYYELTIQDLNSEIDFIKSSIGNQKIYSEKIFRENGELISKCVMSQKNLEIAQVSLEKSEVKIKQQILDINRLLENDRKQNVLLIEANKIIHELKVELGAKSEEKEAVETKIYDILKQFEMLKSNFKDLELEIKDKDRKILFIETEKHELFMKYNWNVCELEKLEQKNLEITNLKKETGKLKNQVDEFEKNKENSCNEIGCLRNKIKELEYALNERYEETLAQKTALNSFRDVISNYEKKLTKLQLEIDKKDSEIQELQKQIYDLNQEIKLPLYEKKVEISDDNLKGELKLLKHIVKYCKLNNPSNLFNGCDKTQEVAILLKVIMSHLEESCTSLEVKNKKIKFLEMGNGILENRIMDEISQLKSREGFLSEKCETTESLLQNWLSDNNENVTNSNCDKNDTVKHLKAVLKVKELHQKNREKRYEANYRTLLRKVKGHMKGRNNAEKLNKYLQDLYNKESEEHNSLKLQTINKECEIKHYKEMFERHKTVESELKDTVMRLESEIAKKMVCDKCIEYQKAFSEYVHLENYVETLKDSQEKYERDIHKMQENLTGLVTENGELKMKIISLSNIEKQYKNTLNKKSNLVKQLNDVQNQVDGKEEVLVKITADLFAKDEELSDISSQKLNVDNLLNLSNDKIRFLENEILIANSNFEQKIEEMQELQKLKCEMEVNLKNREDSARQVFVAFKSQLEAALKQVNLVREEKFFLQKLCRDLKMALEIFVKQNKFLKQQLDNVSKDCESSEEFSSISSGLLALPKYDDNYINELLQQNKNPVFVQPFSDIQQCLDTLKKDILVLQRDISEKRT